MRSSSDHLSELPIRHLVLAYSSISDLRALNCTNKALRSYICGAYLTLRWILSPPLVDPPRSSFHGLCSQGCWRCGRRSDLILKPVRLFFDKGTGLPHRGTHYTCLPCEKYVSNKKAPRKSRPCNKGRNVDAREHAHAGCPLLQRVPPQTHARR